ncbi:MAG TPA: hypothetical protein VGV92_08340 [Gammaproteobacteria bacterium]|nr:hypothetical protein [Gammaproteobacteria bacterium]
MNDDNDITTTFEYTPAEYQFDDEHAVYISDVRFDARAIVGYHHSREPRADLNETEDKKHLLNLRTGKPFSPEETKQIRVFCARHNPEIHISNLIHHSSQIPRNPVLEAIQARRPLRGSNGETPSHQEVVSLLSSDEMLAPTAQPQFPSLVGVDRPALIARLRNAMGRPQTMYFAGDFIGHVGSLGTDQSVSVINSQYSSPYIFASSWVILQLPIGASPNIHISLVNRLDRRQDELMYQSALFDVLSSLITSHSTFVTLLNAITDRQQQQLPFSFLASQSGTTANIYLNSFPRENRFNNTLMLTDGEAAPARSFGEFIPRIARDLSGNFALLVISYFIADLAETSLGINPFLSLALLAVLGTIFNRRDEQPRETQPHRRYSPRFFNNSRQEENTPANTRQLSLRSAPGAIQRSENNRHAAMQYLLLLELLLIQQQDNQQQSPRHPRP